MTEAQFQSKVIKFLRDLDVWHVKVWGGGYQRAGIPDILCCVNGMFVAVELKTETGRPTELQKYNLEQIKTSGGVSFLLRPSGFEDFKKFIREVIKHNEKRTL